MNLYGSESKEVLSSFKNSLTFLNILQLIQKQLKNYTKAQKHSNFI